jgi:hypothetical protein
MILVRRRVQNRCVTTHNPVPARATPVRERAYDE